MKLKLTPEQAQKLIQEVKLSRQLGFPSQTRIAKNYEIDLWTLRRYVNPKYRQYHNISVTTYYWEHKQDTNNCLECKKPLETHDRCVVCSILLHSRDECEICRCGKQHGVKEDQFCSDCMANLHKFII